MKRTKTILMAGFVAGTLDALAAILLFARPVNLHNASRIFRYIASGLFGKPAYTTGFLYPLAGLILHYGIATIWSVVYIFILFRSFKSGSLPAKIFLFASLIWVIMNGLVMPAAALMAHHDGWTILRSWTVLLVCVSMPICLIAEKWIK